jgi:predicted GNAT family N-acyltransferase
VVFVQEQGVPPDIEDDGLDEMCVHFVAVVCGEVVGTLRLRPLDGGAAKVERVAVRAEGRGRGWGRALMDAVEHAAARQGWARLVLHAQESVVGFYERLGWVVVDDRFFEADIPHRRMTRDLAVFSRAPGQALR